MRHVMIMAGGSGTRLWPLSRQGEPKQLLDLLGGPSLLRLAHQRVAGQVPDANVWVCAGAAHMATIAQQLPEVPSGNLLGEPVGRDSLNAIAWSMAEIVGRDPDAVVAVLTADQIISPVEVFRDALQEAFRIAESDSTALVTFGVVPTEAHTGYGYLHRGAELVGHPGCSEITEFVEKPDEGLAKEYLAGGNHWWNSGMFVWRADTWLRQLELLLPRTHQMVADLVAGRATLAETYPQLPKTSVDYAIMEPVAAGGGDAHVVAVPLQISWVDLGGFGALFEQLPKDAEHNATRGAVVTLDAHDNLLIDTRDPGSVLAVVGIAEMVVVATDTATLVLPMAAAQRVKDIVSKVARDVSPELA